MSKGIGRLVTIGINRETQRGTATGTAAFGIAWAELNVDEKDMRALDEQSYGVIEGSVGESIVRQWMEGTIKAPIGDKHFPLMLLSVLGTLQSVTGTATGTPYTHTVTVQQSAQHQSLTLLLDDPVVGQDYTHALTVVSDLEIAYERDKFLSYTASIRGQKGVAANVTPVAASENRFLPQHLTFKVGTAISSIAGGSIIALKSASIKISQNIEDDTVLGSLAPVDYLTKNFVIEGSIEATFQNETDFKNASLTGTAVAARFDLINTGATIGTGTTNPELRIDLYRVTFEPIAKPLKLNDIIMQQLKFKAHYSTSDSKMIAITAVNNQPSY